jgi:hypothetical protein
MFKKTRPFVIVK